MPANKSVLVLPGDGIGPEVMEQVRRVMGWFEKNDAVRFEVEEDLVGGACYDAHGVSVTDATMDKAMRLDAVLLGAVGGPKWDDVPREHRPEAGPLRLRQDLDLFPNPRPTIVRAALVATAPFTAVGVLGRDVVVIPA